MVQLEQQIAQYSYINVRGREDVGQGPYWMWGGRGLGWDG